MKNKKLIFIVILSVVLDQMIKYTIQYEMDYLEIRTIINNFLYITNVKNKGGAFSLFNNSTLLLIIVSIFILGILIYFLKKEAMDKINVVTYGIILGGIIGNLLDRIILGGVIDYISFQFGNYYFPIFNLADIFIVVGVIILLIRSIGSDIYEYKRNHSKRK